MQFKTVFCLFIFGIGVASCSKDGSKSVTEPKPSVNLTVVLGTGVSSNLSAGAQKYASGTKVQYNFTAKSGYNNVAAQLDGSPAGATGTITMDGDRQLFASADSVIVLQPSAEPVKTSAVKFMTSTDTASAMTSYQAYLATIDALYASNPSQALNLAASGDRKAYEDTPDSVREKAKSMLSGKFFGPQTGPSAAGTATQTRTSLIFINGVLNAIDEAATSRKELEKLVSEAGWASSVGVYNFYIGSKYADFTQSDRCLVKGLVIRSLARINTCGLPTDLAKLDAQVHDILQKSGTGLETLAQSLSKIIGQERALGHRVLLVGHSEGTVIAAEANALLRLQDGCVAGISVAGLFAKSTWTPLATPDLQGFVVAGTKAQDLVLSLGLNDFPKIATDLTKAADDRLAISDNWMTRNMEGLRLHEMVESYLAGTESRALLKSTISDMLTALDKKADCSIPAGLRMYASDGAVDAGGSAIGPSHLWLVDPRASGKDSMVAEIKSTSGKSLTVTDIAMSPTRELLGLASDTLYKIDTLSGVATYLINLPSISNTNALSFDAQGRIWVVSHNLGNLLGMQRNTLQVFLRGSYQAGYVSAGDVAYSPDGNLYGIGENTTGDDYLMRVDLTTGNGFRVCTTPIGYTNIWGLNFIGQMLYGLTTDTKTGKGSLITIDLTTCKGTLVRALSFNAFGAKARIAP